MRTPILLCLALLSIVSGCARDFGELCEDPSRYAGGREIPPVQVPDDLSVPDETQALRVPRVAESSPSQPSPSGRGSCLESPPSYFDGSAEGATPANDGEPSRAD
jgi:hypothetical protein